MTIIATAAFPVIISGTVTLTGGTINAFNFMANATSYHYFQTDGTTDHEGINGQAKTQINASTDWIIPNGAASSSYRVRHQSMTGDTGDYVGNITTSYTSINSLLYVAIRDTTPAGGVKSITETVEIDDGTTLQDSASYTQTADREDF